MSQPGIPAYPNPQPPAPANSEWIPHSIVPMKGSVSTALLSVSLAIRPSPATPLTPQAHSIAKATTLGVAYALCEPAMANPAGPRIGFLAKAGVIPRTAYASRRVQRSASSLISQGRVPILDACDLGRSPLIRLVVV